MFFHLFLQVFVFGALIEYAIVNVLARKVKAEKTSTKKDEPTSKFMPENQANGVDANSTKVCGNYSITITFPITDFNYFLFHIKGNCTWLISFNFHP